MQLPKLLVVDDEKDFLASLGRVLKQDFLVDATKDPLGAKEAFEKGPDIVLLDIRLDESNPERRDGLELLREFLENRPDCPIVMISAYGDVNTAVECMRMGAADFIQKPANLNELRQRLKSALDRAKISRKASHLEERIEKLEPIGLVGESPQIQEVKRLIQMVAKDGFITVLVQGETGTGKELVSNAIHRLGWRSKDSFVAVALSSLNPGVIESELFGHEPGAFTGAKGRRIGFIEKAKGGVLFLDEIGDLPSDVQLKLLRFLEERKFFRVGSTESIEVDVQIVVATNRNMEEAVRNGVIREDLFFRLKSIQIFLPPLKERVRDIPFLAKHFLQFFISQGRSRIDCVSEEALDAMGKYHWPGNVRELRAVLERAIIYAKSNGHPKIEKDDLPLEIISKTAGGTRGAFQVQINKGGIDLNEQLAKWDLTYIEEALRVTNGCKTEAWKILGLNDRFALQRRVKTAIKNYPGLIDNCPIIKSLYWKKPIEN